MGCVPCGGGSANASTELWEPVFADQTVGKATTKAEARDAVKARGGFIRRANA